jgi:hypothetical protein
MVGAGKFTTKGGVATVTMVSSSHTSPPSSESLRMRTLSSPGGPRSPRLRSPKSLTANSSAREVSGKSSSSPEERSTGEGGLSEETSNGDTSGGKEPHGAGGGVEASPDEDEDDEPLLDEYGHLVPLLSSIVSKRREREKTLG